ncbi:MAG TPA: TIGR04283 family arsenosugar biosynthesis glycosyltransferase [Acidobacteriota bacterium]|jgi:rSAM/selenodomain-associated transferase 2|nr:TIGR04283 family arsenosugar biosynthesis glycosyltransferase [Acidobacteriota bacterium]
MLISVIVIARNEERELAELLPQLTRGHDVEVIVVDGESGDGTQAVVERCPCRYLSAPAGRARQLNAGARMAQGDVLLFLHADCRLQQGWKTELEEELNNPAVVGGAFSLRMSGGYPWVDRFLSWSGTVNARRSNVFLGDHSIFVRKHIFEKAGGFPDIDLMEDYFFSKKLSSLGQLVQLRSASLASARRFMANGYIKTILQMRLLRLLTALGWSSRRLQSWYLNCSRTSREGRRPY